MEIKNRPLEPPKFEEGVRLRAKVVGVEAREGDNGLDHEYKDKKTNEVKQIKMNGFEMNMIVQDPNGELKVNPKIKLYRNLATENSSINKILTALGYTTKEIESDDFILDIEVLKDKEFEVILKKHKTGFPFVDSYYACKEPETIKAE